MKWAYFDMVYRKDVEYEVVDVGYLEVHFHTYVGGANLF